MPRMLDLCSGLGGASYQMICRGWDVVKIDINHTFKPDIIADVNRLPLKYTYFDLIWASPPCDEFAREFMPWTKKGITPDLSIALSCKKIICDFNPKYFVIENVKGAIKYFNPIFGDYKLSYGPFFLWGRFPDIGSPKYREKKKESYSGKYKSQRALIPKKLSTNLLLAIESQLDILWVTYET